MKVEQKYDVAVVGSGITGIAIAYNAAKQGQKVALFEKNSTIQGASLNNFGIIWPIGQHPNNLSRAMRTRDIWLSLAEEAGFWLGKSGSLTLAHHEDEFHVLEEFIATRRHFGYKCELLTPVKTLAKSKAVNPIKLEGALWSPSELTVDTRQAIPAIQNLLQKKYKVDFHFSTPIQQITSGYLHYEQRGWNAERIFICTGEELSDLFPDIFQEQGLVKRKLKLMRTAKQPTDWQLGAALASGLTLQNFPAFEHCESLALVRSRLNRELQANRSWGSQFIISQSPWNELIIGDSREYTPMDEHYEDQHVLEKRLKSLGKLIRIPSMRINESWTGTYSKIKGDSEFVGAINSGTIIVNGLGGFGLTQAFGLAEDIMNGKIKPKTIKPSKTIL